MTTSGTSFYHAYLIKCNFTSAELKNSNFDNAIITHANLHKVKKLDLSKLNRTILNDEKILDLLVTHNGKNQSFVNYNLEGVNLSNANLSNANLESANINEAILKNANLENANLSKVQALSTNFKQANLTGACIKDWNVNNQTIFDSIICKYIYLEKEQKQRIPKKGEFTSEEFTNFYIKAFKTIELIFSNKIDWQSFLTSFNNEYNDVVNNYNEALAIAEEKYKFQILSKNEQIQEYKEEIKHLKNRIEILNESILDLTSIKKKSIDIDNNL